MASPPIVNTDCGPVRGSVSSEGVASFLSIPFAAPPVGELRWQPPAAAHCWNGTLDATSFAPACLQKAEYGPGGSSAEDCLKLNVWAPVKRDRSLPTFVWLHGGGLLEGSSHSIQSGFEAVGRLPLSLGAVVVGVEYRIGVAGFLALDALAERDSRGGGLVGNYGLLDVIAALEWVQRNVAQFGGDAGRVTVAGQSSGGSLVFALLASPAARGLLHGAISLSGSPRLNSTTAEASGYWHRQVVARTRCAPLVEATATAAPQAPPPGGLAGCLLSLNASELLAATPPNWHADVDGLGVFEASFQYAPLLLIDGPTGVLPAPYVDAAGVASPHVDGRVALVVGATAQEADFSPTDDVRNLTSRAAFAAYLRRRLSARLGAPLVERVIDLYVVDDDDDDRESGGGGGGVEGGGDGGGGAFEPQRVYDEIASDAVVVCPNFYLASSWDAAPARTAPVFAYRASQRLSKPFCVLRNTAWSPPYCPLYSFHASDMFPWLRPRPTAAFDYTFTPTDVAYGELIRRQLGAVVNGTSAGAPSAARRCATRCRAALPPPSCGCPTRRRAPTRRPRAPSGLAAGGMSALGSSTKTTC